MKNKIIIVVGIVCILVIYCGYHIWTNNEYRGKRYLQNYGWTVSSCDFEENLSYTELVDSKMYSVVFNEFISKNKNYNNYNDNFIVYRYNLDEIALKEKLQAYILFSGATIVDARISGAEYLTVFELRKYGIESFKNQGLNVLDPEIYFPVTVTLEDIKNGFINSLNSNS